jgi:CheY-like chemotaxis protein
MPYGKVLVVDDVEANLYVIKGLLAFYDLNIDTCESGYKALEKIRQGNVYDIVFMDEMMPGISGTETMQQIRNMGYSHPIIALTANAMIGQAEAFIKEGFDGFISKPIQTTRLNSILIKHIKDKQPLGIIEAAKSGKLNISKPDFNEFQCDPVLLTKLRADFAKRHSSTFFNICYSIKTGDIETAHRLTHTIKGLGGILYEEALASAANVVEQTLAAKGNPTRVQLKALEIELNRVLACIGEVQTVASDEVDYIGTAEALSLLEALAPLLASKNAACMKMLDDIRKIPQSELLYNQIEDFNFTIALETLGELKKALGGE